MSGILFSIIIPAYNSAKTIEATLQSIVIQSYKAIEIILVDGGSKDDTIAITKKFAFNDLQYTIISEPDKGVYDAMNKGIKKCKGNWLYFLGSDDVIYDSMVFADMAKAIINHPQVEMVYGNVMLEKPSFGGSIVYDGPFDHKKIFDRNLSHQSVFYAKQLVDKTGLYNLNYVVCADYDYNLRCFSKTSPLYIDRIICTFSHGGLSSTVTDYAFSRDKLKNSLILYHAPATARYIQQNRDEVILLVRWTLKRLKIILFGKLIARYHSVIFTTRK